MDSDGLPIVGAGIDYTKVDPFHQKRTLTFLNHFLIRTTSFLNHFATICDEKLENLLVRIQRLEASMCILEAKLASIPGLEDVSINDQPQSTEMPSQVPVNDTTPTPPQVAETVETPKMPVPDEKPKIKVSQDLRFAKYFKMVNMGVPAIAVKQKMKSEGANPDLLDDPDAETIPGAPEISSQNDSNSESDLSD